MGVTSWPQYKEGATTTVGWHEPQAVESIT